MTKTLGRFAAIAAVAGIMLGGAATASATEYKGSFRTPEACEAEAVKYRSSDVAAVCWYDRGHAEWDLLVWSIGG